MADQKNILVFSAHAADFVWRAGGAIALYASRGYRLRILCLSFGERGESQETWKEPGITVERVKEIRREEASRAAAILGAFLWLGSPLGQHAVTVADGQPNLEDLDIVASSEGSGDAMDMLQDDIDFYDWADKTANSGSATSG